MIDWIIGPFLSFLLLYKYGALFIIAFVAALAIPIPASTTLLAAGAFASQGYLQLEWVITAALLGNVAGDVTGYVLAQRYGEEVLHRLGFGRVLRARRYHQLKGYIYNYPEPLIFITRFLTEAGPAVNILAGLSKVPVRTFILFDVLGEVSYVLLNALLGYSLGTQWEQSTGFLIKVAITVIPIGLTINLIQILIFRRRRVREEPAIVSSSPDTTR